LNLPQGVILHLALEFTALLIEFIQLQGEAISLLAVLAQQAANANAHVFEAPRRIQARADGKAQVRSIGVAVIAIAGAQQRE
jgi:hypothetical protein